MDSRDIIVGTVAGALVGGHTRTAAFAVDVQTRDALSCDDLSPTLRDDIYQGVSHLLAAADEAVLSADIQHVNQGVDISWRTTSHSAVHRVHIGQHVAQPLILNIVGNKVACRPQELLAVTEKVVLTRAEIKEVHLVGQLVECLHIPSHVVGLVGKPLCKVFCEGFTSLGHAVGVLSHDDAVHTVGIAGEQFQPAVNA